jgi:hypothetical protein
MAMGRYMRDMTLSMRLSDAVAGLFLKVAEVIWHLEPEEHAARSDVFTLLGCFKLDYSGIHVTGPTACPGHVNFFLK